MLSTEIRNSFLQFFAGKEHQFVRSSPVISTGDPTLLFTNAGMNQFKNIFLGDNKNNWKRVANSQKCIRVSGKHNDLEEVGRDTYHHTFFEMLGNWSFGDYYKKEAIAWAWELLTEVWKLDKKRLFITVYRDDDEAAQLWQEVAGVPADRILRFGEKENFWEMGDTGPCGPCSEIHYDTGDPATQAATFADKIAGVNGSNARYIEIWNLVFIQYERLASRELKPLKSKHVDTGMGFERICSIIAGTYSNYETDVFRPLIDEIAARSGVPYSAGPDGMPHRVIADHLRTLAFAIADGAMPGNEGRGYVLRRILRRASRYARKLGRKEPFISSLIPRLVAGMGEAFPEIRERATFVIEVIHAEEERFVKTLDQGLDRIGKVMDGLEREKNTVISGRDAFLLHDTYGFPFDLTCLIAGERGLTVDQAEYDTCMKAQNDRAREAAKFGNALAGDEGWTILSPATVSEFTGYDSTTGTGKVLRWKDDGKFVWVALDCTPFYPEMGGQVGDQGRLLAAGIELAVLDTVKALDLIVHKCKVKEGALPGSGECMLQAEVNRENRLATVRNHSATHLLQAALRQVLGTHVQQQGSRVAPESLRFDFTHFQALTPDEMERIEDLVNAQVRANLPVSTTVKNLDEAKASGAMALFGEKYEDDVRVVQMGAFSLELCGGTHATATGQIGLVKILGESSIAAGVRRIEALTGKAAVELARGNSRTLQQLGQLLKCKAGEEIVRLEELQAKLKAREKELEELKTLKAAEKAKEIITKSQEKIGSTVLIYGKFETADKNEGQLINDQLQNSLPADAIGITTSTIAGQEWSTGTTFTALCGSSLKAKLPANQIIKALESELGGRGGGRPERAQASYKNSERDKEILERIRQMIREKFPE